MRLKKRVEYLEHLVDALKDEIEEQNAKLRLISFKANNPFLYKTGEIYTDYLITECRAEITYDNNTHLNLSTLRNIYTVYCDSDKSVSRLFESTLTKYIKRNTN